MAACSTVSESMSLPCMDTSDLNPEFTVGETFPTFNELEKKVKLYEEKHFMKLFMLAHTYPNSLDNNPQRSPGPA